MYSLACRIALVLFPAIFAQNVCAQLVFKDCPDCPDMVVIPAGIFTMGSSEQEQALANPYDSLELGTTWEKPQHRVKIEGFAIGKYEVTQEQWFAVMDNNPSANRGRQLPVENVSWDEVQEFIAKLNQKTGRRYRLPIEAEWEYAARAGSSTYYPFGNNARELNVYAWFLANAGATNPVGLKRPNDFGLYDMLGNVWEWTQDCWHDSYVDAPADGSAWTTSCLDGRRVVRGGAWGSDSAYLRSAVRRPYSHSLHDHGIGFRLAKSL